MTGSRRFHMIAAFTIAATSSQAPRARAAVGSYNQAVWSDSDRKVVSTRQTSLVIDPPDGRVPVRPDAEQQLRQGIDRDRFDIRPHARRATKRSPPRRRSGRLHRALDRLDATREG